MPPPHPHLPGVHFLLSVSLHCPLRWGSKDRKALFPATLVALAAALCLGRLP